MTTYRTHEELDDTGLAHLFDDQSAGFPLCGQNIRPNKGEPRRGLCGHCREAAGRVERERTPTPVEVWAPAFAKILPEELTSEIVFSNVGDWRLPGQGWCNLCETWVKFADRETHVRSHERERREFRKRESGRALGDGNPVAPSPSGRPTGRSKTEQEEEMSNTASTTEAPDVSGLYETLTARLKERIDGVKVESKKNKSHAYAAVVVEGKNVGYISQGKRGVSVQIRKGKDAGTRSVKSESEVGTAVTALAKVADTVRTEPKTEAKAPAKTSGKGRKSKKTPVAA